MIPAVQTFAALVPTYNKSLASDDLPKVEVFADTESQKEDAVDRPVSRRDKRPELLPGFNSVEQMVDFRKADASHRLVSRYSVVEELSRESKDSGLDSGGGWVDNFDRKSDDEDKSESSNSDIEHLDASSHFPILDPSQNSELSVNEISVYAYFVKIGDIDTKNQRFSAHVELIARWIPEKNKLFNDFFKACKEHPYADLEHGGVWTRKVIPKLIINNLESSAAEKTSFSMRPTSATEYLDVRYVEMHKVVKGIFYERLELESFPFDVQDVCLRLSLDHSSQNFKLVIPKRDTPAGLIDDKTTFQDDQEWVLRRVVAAGENNVEEEIQDDQDDENPMLVIRTNVQRKSNYFVYNCFLVMVFFAIMSYGNFANKPENVQFRLGGALTLVLTAVTYKLMLSNSLPTISYLTLIDIYVLFQIFMMTNLAVTFAVLHWVWRWYADDLDLFEEFRPCERRFEFVTPTNLCELRALSNLLDVICFSVHATVQIIFNITFTTYAYRKVKKESDHFEEQEKDYKNFLETHPEMQEMWRKQNFPRKNKTLPLKAEDLKPGKYAVSRGKGGTMVTDKNISALRSSTMIT